MKSLSVPATMDSLTDIASFVRAVADAADLSPRPAYRLRLAVDEFIANIILYAYPGAVVPGVVELRAEEDDKSVTITIEDRGIPFDPLQVPPPPDLHLPAEQRKLGGLGIYLALQSIDHFAYKRVGDRNQNVIVVSRTPAPRGARSSPLSSARLPLQESFFMPSVKGKIGVLVESHFDETEYHRFGEFFPARGYAIEYLSHLWGHEQLTFKGNDLLEEVTVSKEINDAALADYIAIILIGGYAMDRLRFEENPMQGRSNQSPGVVFLRKAVAEMDRGRLRIGAICHGLWLFCAAPDLLKGRKVTCAHNIISDVHNAGGVPVFDGSKLADTWVDGNLITGRHPGVVEAFLKVFTEELEIPRRPQQETS